MFNTIQKTKDELVKEKVVELNDKLKFTASMFASNISEMIDIVFSKHEDEYITQEIFDLIGTDGNTLLQLVGGAKQLLSILGADKYPINPARKKLTPTQSGVQVSELDNPIDFIN